MSTFIYIERRGPDGSMESIRRAEVAAVVEKLPRLKLLNDDTDDTVVGIRLPGAYTAAILDGMSLSCQINPSTDLDLLLEQLREIADALPGAVVVDEEGETY